MIRFQLILQELLLLFLVLITITIQFRHIMHVFVSVNLSSQLYTVKKKYHLQEQPWSNEQYIYSSWPRRFNVIKSIGRFFMCHICVKWIDCSRSHQIPYIQYYLSLENRIETESGDHLGFTSEQQRGPISYKSVPRVPLSARLVPNQGALPDVGESYRTEQYRLGRLYSLNVDIGKHLHCLLLQPTSFIIKLMRVIMV